MCMEEEELIEMLEKRLQNYECDGQMSIFDVFGADIGESEPILQDKLQNATKNIDL